MNACSDSTYTQQGLFCSWRFWRTEHHFSFSLSDLVCLECWSMLAVLITPKINKQAPLDYLKPKIPTPQTTPAKCNFKNKQVKTVLAVCVWSIACGAWIPPSMRLGLGCGSTSSSVACQHACCEAGTHRPKSLGSCHYYQRPEGVSRSWLLTGVRPAVVGIYFKRVD